MGNTKVRISLQKKIVLTVSMVTVLMVSFITVFSTYSLHNSVNQAYVSQISGITVAINGRYEESHSVADVQQIFEYIKQTISSYSVVGRGTLFSIGIPIEEEPLHE